MLDSLKLVYYYEMFSYEHCEVVMFFNKLSVQFSCITDVLVYLRDKVTRTNVNAYLLSNQCGVIFLVFP